MQICWECIDTSTAPNIKCIQYKKHSSTSQKTSLPLSVKNCDDAKVKRGVRRLVTNPFQQNSRDAV